MQIVAHKLVYQRVLLDDRRRFYSFRDKLIDSVCSSTCDVTHLVRELEVIMAPLERTYTHIESIRESLLCILANVPHLDTFRTTDYTSGYAEISCLHRNNALTLSSLSVTVTSNSKGIFQLLGQMAVLRILAIDIVNMDEWTHPTQHCLCMPTLLDFSWTCPDSSGIEEEMLVFITACRFGKLGKMSLHLEDLSDEGAVDLIPFLQCHSPLSGLTLSLSSDACVILAPHIVSASHLCLRGAAPPPNGLLRHIKFPKKLDLHISGDLIQVHDELTQFLKEMATVELASIGIRELRIRIRDRPFLWLDGGGPADMTRLALMAVLLPLAIKLYNRGVHLLDTNDKDVAWLVHDMVAQLSA